MRQGPPDRRILKLVLLRGDPAYIAIIDTISMSPIVLRPGLDLAPVFGYASFIAAFIRFPVFVIRPAEER